MKTFEDFIARKLSSEEAIELAKSGVTNSWTSEQIVRFQLFQQYFAFSLERYQKAMEDVLGRQVYAHEFMNRESHQLEYLETKNAPSIDEILSLIPSEKLLITNMKNG